jgi:hypothetical protein
LFRFNRRNHAKKKQTGGLFDCELPKVERVKLKDAFARKSIREIMATFYKKAEERRKQRQSRAGA